MAASLERFSIREYSAKTRGFDVAECWPFGKDDSLKSLPPISVPKFHWWAHELEARRRKETKSPKQEVHRGAFQCVA
ncbi:uncharacterized protein A4U43_C05F9920 [Asparagus officinalis]|uniref:Uncharacterized protein n=1 Tax=Asparagus officinalis TaxID=4686 RepID=A0A5P1ERL7_ASPOF|nr:uncharacterized protein A4U43_C05F9920 [Asparagus officinalis]